MIVGDLDIPGRAIAPYKAEPPLIVDANAVLALTIAAQSLQTVTGRHPQIVQLPGGINGQKLRAGAPLNLYRKPFGGSTIRRSSSLTADCAFHLRSLRYGGQGRLKSALQAALR